MKQESLSLMHYLFGIVIAIAVFLVKDFITNVRSGFRFRKRLSSDIKMVVEGYYRHLPELSELKRKLSEALDALRSGGKTETSVAPIWDSEFSLLAEVYQNSVHLNTNVFQEVVLFYNTVARLEEIRQSYNEIVRKIVASEEHTAALLGYLNSCLVNMKSNYREVLNRGCNALIGLSQKHWFLSIDIAHYRNILAQISSQENSIR